MNLSQYENEDALDLLADIMEPLSEIVGDDGFQKHWASGKPIMFAVTYAMRHKKKECIRLVAAIHREDPKEFRFNTGTLLNDLISLMQEPMFQSFFPRQGQANGLNVSGSVTESTVDENE